jgi:hypothetical protein
MTFSKWNGSNGFESSDLHHVDYTIMQVSRGMDIMEGAVDFLHLDNGNVRVYYPRRK